MSTKKEKRSEAEMLPVPAEALAEDEAPAEDPVQPKANAADVDAIFGRLPKGTDAFAPRTILKPRRVSFAFDGANGAPGVFTDDAGNYLDIVLTMESLDSAREIDAMKSVGENPAALPFLMAKAMLVEVSGKRLTPEQKDFVWDAIGSQGRQLCLMASQSLGGSVTSALGKYQSSFTVG